MLLPGNHEISQHFNVIMILETILHMTEKLEYVQSVNTCIQQCIHTLESSFSQVQPIIDFVFKRSHLNLSDQFFTFLCFIIKLWQDILEKISDKAGFVVGSTVECHQGHSSYVEIWILECCKEMT